MGASPREGSSNIMSFGFAMSPLPIATICCSPPLRVPAACRLLSLRRGEEPVDHLLDCSLPFFASPFSEPMSRFSSTVISTKSRRASGTWTMPASTSRNGSTVWIGLPSKWISPFRGQTRPDTVFRIVDFPAPLAPIRRRPLLSSQRRKHPRSPGHRHRRRLCSGYQAPCDSPR